MTQNLYEFPALGCSCSIQVQGASGSELERLGIAAKQEVSRIEEKYSRYKPTSALSQINNSGGKPVQIDNETYQLLHYADQCWNISEGLFDITSGVLRRVWKFDGSDNIPNIDEVEAILPLIGWDKVSLKQDSITLTKGMQIDFGGLGKEYAVDRVCLLLMQETDLPILVNFGGDLRVSGPREGGEPWRIAMEAVEDANDQVAMLNISGGALTTSGDAKRFLLKDGVRYSHILDPRTGWPVKDPPRAVTIAASTCMEAGILSTLAMLHGNQAEAFLENERVAAWVLR